MHEIAYLYIIDSRRCFLNNKYDDLAKINCSNYKKMSMIGFCILNINKLVSIVLFFESYLFIGLVFYGIKLCFLCNFLV